MAIGKTNDSLPATAGEGIKLEAADVLVETGESRTLLSIDQAISKDTPYVPYLSTNSVLESSLQQVWEPTKLQSDPTKLLPQLLDQLIALGQTAQQLRHALGSNGYRPEKISEVIQQLTEGGDHAH